MYGTNRSVLNINLFDYRDYQTYLKDYLHSKRGLHRGFSYAVWSKQLKMKSASTLIMVINGQRRIGPRLREQIEHYFKYNESEKAYFRDLVLLKECKEAAETNRVMERVSAQARRKPEKILSAQEFELISDWHLLALREFVHLKDFSSKKSWFLNRFRYSISTSEIDRSIRLLKKLKLWGGPGTELETSAPHFVDTAKDVKDKAVQKFHSQSLKNAIESIENVPVEDREMASSIFAIKKESLPKAKELIRRFQKQFMDCLEETSADDVYQIQISFIPLTRGET